MSDEKEDALRKKRIIAAMKNETVETTACTGDRITVYVNGFRPLTDTHMHMQSNNCCPLPLQWDIIGRKSPLASSRPKDNRRTMNDTSAGTIASTLAVGRMGKIGRLRTELIGELYMGKLDINDMNKQNAMSVMTEAEWDNLVKNKGVASARAEAAKRAELSTLNTTSVNKYADQFFDTTAYYYQNQHVYHLAVALMMNLSYAHFWGRWRIPVYIPFNNNFYYINDFMMLHRQEAMFAQIIVSVDDDIVTPETVDGQYDKKLHLYPRFISGDLLKTNFYQEEFRKFKDFKALPSGTKPKEKFSLSFSGDMALCQNLVNKQYVHLLEQIPQENAEVYESFPIQIKWSIRSLLKYPFQYFSFYHIDPRNIKRNDTDTSNTLSALNNHAFFTYSKDLNTKITYEDDYTQTGLFNLTPAEPSSNTSFFSSHLAVPENAMLLDLIFDNMIHSPATKASVFWGVKVYPRLGWAPDDFTNHPELQYLFQKCSDYQIPITSHCSPGGMTIADYFNFERYAYLRSKLKYNFDDSATFFDNKYDTPSNWENVLKTFPKLKLDLAHFGGEDLWKKIGSFPNEDKKPVDLSKVPESHPRARYISWIKKICILTRDYDNCYTDISYFKNALDWTNNYPSQTVENIVYLLNQFPSLKDRLLIGTDWYMIELDGFEGAGKYLKQMFLTLKEVSKRVGYDAWHQFGIINPFRFLGIIDDKKGVKGPYSLKQPLLDKYENEMNKLLKNQTFVDNLQLASEKDQILNFIQVNRKKFRETEVIPDSSEIKASSGKLLILSE